uniref:PEHE domain-containing protein n=1 Tax=Mycena chlorophos TaxID=658473 RepID=A0ABQ0M2F6_MYCCL|nr:predicted protein [Mycena chlorophos]
MAMDSDATFAASIQPQRVQPSRARKGAAAGTGSGLGTCDIDRQLLNMEPQPEPEPDSVVPVDTVIHLTTDSSLAAYARAFANNAAAGSAAINVTARESYFDRPEVIQGYREQLLIETPSYEIGVAPPLLQARQGPAVEEDSDEVYIRQHNKFERFEKQQRNHEKEKLKHEQYKLQERIAQFQAMQPSVFANAPASWFSLPPAPSVVVDGTVDLYDSIGPPVGTNPVQWAEGKRRKAELLANAAAMEERYKVLLQKNNKTQKKNGKEVDAFDYSAMVDEGEPELEEPQQRPKGRAQSNVASGSGTPPTPKRTPTASGSKKRRRSSIMPANAAVGRNGSRLQTHNNDFDQLDPEDGEYQPTTSKARSRAGRPRKKAKTRDNRNASQPSHTPEEQYLDVEGIAPLQAIGQPLPMNPFDAAGPSSQPLQHSMQMPIGYPSPMFSAPSPQHTAQLPYPPAASEPSTLSSPDREIEVQQSTDVPPITAFETVSAPVERGKGGRRGTGSTRARGRSKGRGRGGAAATEPTRSLSARTPRPSARRASALPSLAPRPSTRRVPQDPPPDEDYLNPAPRSFSTGHWSTAPGCKGNIGDMYAEIDPYALYDDDDESRPAPKSMARGHSRKPTRTRLEATAETNRQSGRDAFGVRLPGLFRIDWLEYHPPPEVFAVRVHLGGSFPFNARRSALGGDVDGDVSDMTEIDELVDGRDDEEDFKDDAEVPLDEEEPLQGAPALVEEHVEQPPPLIANGTGPNLVEHSLTTDTTLFELNNGLVSNGDAMELDMEGSTEPVEQLNHVANGWPHAHASPRRETPLLPPLRVDPAPEEDEQPDEADLIGQPNPRSKSRRPKSATPNKESTPGKSTPGRVRRKTPKALAAAAAKAQQAQAQFADDDDDDFEQNAYQES